MFGREARGRSPAYESLAASVAGDDQVLGFLALVIYHSAVLAYVAPADRERFAQTVRGLTAVWLSNEAPGVVPGLPRTRFREGTFVLGHGGRTPLAFTDGHGTWLHWLDGKNG